MSANNSLQLMTTLDREKIESYRVTVVVENSAECNRTGNHITPFIITSNISTVPEGDCKNDAEVVVMVTDINDNAPQFTERSYSGGMTV